MADLTDLLREIEDLEKALDSGNVVKSITIAEDVCRYAKDVREVYE